LQHDVKGSRPGRAIAPSHGLTSYFNPVPQGTHGVHYPLPPRGSSSGSRCVFGGREYNRKGDRGYAKTSSWNKQYHKGRKSYNFGASQHRFPRQLSAEAFAPQRFPSQLRSRCRRFIHRCHCYISSGGQLRPSLPLLLLPLLPYTFTADLTTLLIETLSLETPDSFSTLKDLLE